MSKIQTSSPAMANHSYSRKLFASLQTRWSRTAGLMILFLFSSSIAIGQEGNKADDLLTDFLLDADRVLEKCAVLTIAVHNYNNVLKDETRSNEISDLWVHSAKAQASYFASGVSYHEENTGTAWYQELDQKGRKSIRFGLGNIGDSKVIEEPDTPKEKRQQRFRYVADPFATGAFPDGEINLGHGTMDHVKDAMLDATLISEEQDQHGNVVALYLMTPQEYMQVQVTFSAKHGMKPIEWKWMSGPRTGTKKTVVSKQVVEWKKIGENWLPVKTKRIVNFGGVQSEGLHEHFWKDELSEIDKLLAESNLNEQDWRPRFFTLFPEAASFLNAKKLLESVP